MESAADVAKEAADIVLLERDLGVLVQGVQEGRITFGNTLKYVFMATSANFGNMFSMAGVSLFLPFLPLLPKQILLTNLMTDFPEMTIATDRVDAEMVETPRRWDTRFIRNFMMTFGLVSSVFDYATFGVLHLLGATAQQFRTGWFLESVVSASLVVLVVRTRRPFFMSRPSRPLALATGASWRRPSPFPTHHSARSSDSLLSDLGTSPRSGQWSCSTSRPPSWRSGPSIGRDRSVPADGAEWPAGLCNAAQTPLACARTVTGTDMPPTPSPPAVVVSAPANLSGSRHVLPTVVGPPFRGAGVRRGLGRVMTVLGGFGEVLIVALRLSAGHPCGRHPHRPAVWLVVWTARAFWQL